MLANLFAVIYSLIMKLITNNAELMAHIPNTINSVKGETALFDKIAVHLAHAEAWVEQYITSPQVLTAIATRPAGDELRKELCRLIVADALTGAIPMLDLVFTPNGFAVTQTSNLAPASKQRVDRLIGAMQGHRNCTLHCALDLLPLAKGWCDTPQGRFFGESLFPNIDLAMLIPSQERDHWQLFLKLRLSAIAIEFSLGEEFFSAEQLEAWRDRSLRRTMTDADKVVVHRIRHQVVECLNDKPVNARRMADLVNYIRQRPEDFPEWHRSATAKLFTPPIFRNTKNSPGYFF